LARDSNYLVSNNRHIFCSDGLETTSGMEALMEPTDGLDGRERIDHHFIDGGFDADLRLFILLCLSLLSGLSGTAWCPRILSISYSAYELSSSYSVLVPLRCPLLRKHSFRPSRLRGPLALSAPFTASCCVAMRLAAAAFDWETC
jgi:hypothetical protein